MKPPRTCFAMVAALMLAACVGPGHDTSVTVYPGIPAPLHAHHAPIVDLDGTLHVGANVGAPARQLTLIAHHGETGVSHGSVRDGVGAAEVVAYLHADASSPISDDEDDRYDQVFPDGLLVRFGSAPPTVRAAQGTAPQMVGETLRVVQTINAALPWDWQLGFSRERPPADGTMPSHGEILVEFAPGEAWSDLGTPPEGEDIGLALPQYAIEATGDPRAPFRFEIVAGRIWVDPTRTSGDERLGVIAHEIIHLLGRGHVDPMRFPATIMVPGGSEELSEHILHPLDREALLAVYSRLDAGTVAQSIAEELGPWSDISMHVRGDSSIPGGEIAFGAALRNGLSQPWAFGPAPAVNLEDNPELAGPVRWAGRLTGLTPDAEIVAGAANVTVELSTLSGTVDFTGLEHWAAHAPPGAMGTGAVWHDGEFNYRMEVRGNTFVQTGGDAGTVTGAFFGSAHEGMGGVLQRDDLSAGYGGKRQL